MVRRCTARCRATASASNAAARPGPVAAARLAAKPAIRRKSNAGRGSLVLTMTASAPEPAQAVAARLGVAMHWVPALRERAADIAVLWNSFAAQRAPGMRLVLGDDARQALEAAGWVGNLAELRAVVEHVVASGRRGVVRVEDLPDGVRSKRAWSMIERTEMEAIRRALQETGGNRSRAAELLGISRATIHRKMKAYHISG